MYAVIVVGYWRLTMRIIYNMEIYGTVETNVNIVVFVLLYCIVLYCIVYITQLLVYSVKNYFVFSLGE